MSHSVFTNAEFALREIHEARVAFAAENDLETVSQFACALPQFLSEETLEAARRDLDTFLDQVLDSFGVRWRKVEKRTPLHTALLHVFFRAVEVFIPGRFASRSSFAAQFPHLRDRADLGPLMHFANALCRMSEFIQPQHNKQVFMAVAGSLESSCKKRYVTGGAQTKDTTVRVELFRSLFGVQKMSRATKRRAEQLVSSSSSEEAPSEESSLESSLEYLLASPFVSSDSDSEQDPPAKRSRPQQDEQDWHEIASIIIEAFDDPSSSFDDLIGFQDLPSTTTPFPDLSLVEGLVLCQFP